MVDEAKAGAARLRLKATPTALAASAAATPAVPARIGRRRAAAVGAVAGLASGLLGVGGGFLIVPLLSASAKTDPRRVSGTSLAAILPIAIVGAGRYYFGAGTPRISLSIAFCLVVGSVVGAYLGARSIHLIPRRALQVLVAGSLLLVGLDEVLRALVPSALVWTHGSGPAALDPARATLIALSGLVIGVLSGLTGVGGGVFLVPTMVIAFGVGQHVAQGTSLLAILPTAAVGAAAHVKRGNVDAGAAAWIGATGAPTALLGASLALALPQGLLAALFGGFLLIAAARMWPKRPARGD
jgi:uncharacterized membrane protein YfcA